MTKNFDSTLKIKGGGGEAGTCKVLRPCPPLKIWNVHLVLNFYRVYQRINKISEMNMRLFRASNVNSKEVYFFHNISEFNHRFRIFKFTSI